MKARAVCNDRTEGSTCHFEGTYGDCVSAKVGFRSCSTDRERSTPLAGAIVYNVHDMFDRKTCWRGRSLSQRVAIGTNDCDRPSIPLHA